MFVKGNIKKILKLRDQRDYKDKVKKMFKQMYNDCQKKYEKNVRRDGITSYHILYLEKTLLSEWDDCCLHLADRLRALYHECW